jgi:hypothetical protein
VERQTGRVVFFFRAQPAHAVREASVHTDLSFVVVGPNALEHMQVRARGPGCRRLRSCNMRTAALWRCARRSSGRAPPRQKGQPFCAPPLSPLAGLPPSAGDAVPAVHAAAHAGGSPMGARRRQR